MYLHKYDVDGKRFFLLSDAPSKPAGSFTITQDDWVGKSTGKTTIQTIRQLEALTYDKAEETEKVPEAPKEEAKKKVEALDKIAEMLQNQGRADLALRLDKVSDKLESRK